MTEERLIEFGCECGAAWCDTTVRMTLSERDRVDHFEGLWAIAPEHPTFGSDAIIERHGRYWVVSSQPGAA